MFFLEGYDVVVVVVVLLCVGGGKVEKMMP